MNQNIFFWRGGGEGRVRGWGDARLSEFRATTVPNCFEIHALLYKLSGRTHGRTHIHQTKIVTTMSRLPASGLYKKYSMLSLFFEHPKVSKLPLT